MKNPSISIIICCYNSSKLICKTLDFIGKQTVKDKGDFEVILVDNASTDTTSTIAIEFWNLNYKSKASFTIINETKQGIAFARQAGVKACKGNFILFCDDDNWLETNYVSIALAFMEKNPLVGVLGGENYGFLEIEEPDWWQSKVQGYAVGAQAECSGNITERGYVWGAGMVIRKELLVNLYKCGFKSLLIGRKGEILSAGDDSELCKWIILQGYKLWYLEELKLTHYITKNRLTNEYVEKLYKGHEDACQKLSLYDTLISNRNNYNSKNLIKSFKIYIKYLLDYKIDSLQLVKFQIEIGSKFRIHKEVYQIIKTYTKINSFKKV